MKKNIDGAILTLTGYFNYGNIIQRYALQKFLKENGNNFVSYVETYSVQNAVYNIPRKVKLKTPLRAVKRYINYQKPYWYMPSYTELFPAARNQENIIKFVNKNISIKPFDPNDNYKNYIVGSDQIWRDWWNNRETLGYYFLNFLKGRKANRIAYAASFGKDRISEVMPYDYVDYIRPYIEQFNDISVREESGRQVIADTWGIKNTEQVVDPTLLLDKSVYSKLIEKSDSKYEEIQPIFAYVLSETKEANSFIRKISSKRKQAVTKIQAHKNDEEYVLPPVELWLKGFRDAELVVTNSFHGMMMSVVNNTDFIIIGKETGGLSRINDFLSEYGLEARFVSEENLKAFDMDNLKSIDWSKINRRLAKNCHKSGEWLLSKIK